MSDRDRCFVARFLDGPWQGKNYLTSNPPPDTIWAYPGGEGIMPKLTRPYRLRSSFDSRDNVALYMEEAHT